MRKFATYRFSPNGNHVLLQLDDRGEAKLLETTPDGRTVRHVVLFVDAIRSRALIEAAPRVVAAIHDVGGDLAVEFGRGAVPSRRASCPRRQVAPEVEVFCRQMESLAHSVAQHATPVGPQVAQQHTCSVSSASSARTVERSRRTWDHTALGLWSILFFVVHLLAFGIGSLGFELASTMSGTIATVAGVAAMLLSGGAAHYALGALFGRAYPNSMVSWQPSLVAVLMLVALFLVAGHGIAAIVWSTFSFPVFALLGQWARSDDANRPAAATHG